MLLKILDDKNLLRRFRVSNYNRMTKVNPFCCSMPLRLNEGWNQIQFNLPDFTLRAYGTKYIETVRIVVNISLYSNLLYMFMSLLIGLYYKAKWIL